MGLGSSGSIVVSILALGILIIFHEAGHYWAARLSGMSVRKFSIGFGPPIAKVTRGETEFQLCIIPLGGYVQIDGMSPHDGTDPNAPGSYQAKPFHQKFATILAGPWANYLLGFLLLFVFYAAFNYESHPPVRVERLAKDGAAAAAGLKVGDLLVGTKKGEFKAVSELRDVIRESQGGPIDFQVQREGKVETVRVTPKKVTGGFLIGIEFDGSRKVSKPLGLGDSAKVAWHEIWAVSGGLLKGLAALVTPGTKVEVSGPIGMVKGLSRRVKRSWTDAIGDVARISIMLGLFNLLPIPALDGSRLMFLLVGLVRRKEVEPKIEAVVHAVGLLMLLGMMLVVSIFDVLR